MYELPTCKITIMQWEYESNNSGGNIDNEGVTRDNEGSKDIEGVADNGRGTIRWQLPRESSYQQHRYWECLLVIGVLVRRRLVKRGTGNRSTGVPITVMPTGGYGEGGTD